MSEPAASLQIPELLLDGFAAESATGGQSVKVIVSGTLTSDQPLFHLYAIQILRTLSRRFTLEPRGIDRLLVLVHDDNSADVYINDFAVLAHTSVTRRVQPGELLHSNDMSDIHSVTFPGILIKPTDKIIYPGRHEWRFGLYFDFTRSIGGDKWATAVAELLKELLLRDFLITTQVLLAQKSPATYRAFLVTEGKTDWRHLKRAADALRIHGIEYDETDRDRGDMALLSVCKEIAVVPQAKPVIFVFDRDNERIIRELESGGAVAPYQDWGNNVFSMLLPVPKHRTEYKRISIEMYYPDEVLRRADRAGRRLCFGNEIKTEIYPDKTIRKILIPPDTEKEMRKQSTARTSIR